MKLQSWIKSNVTPKILLVYSHCPLLPPFQCYRLAVVCALAENSASRCLSHSLINID